MFFTKADKARLESRVDEVLEQIDKLKPNRLAKRVRGIETDLRFCVRRGELARLEEKLTRVEFDLAKATTAFDVLLEHLGLEAVATAANYVAIKRSKAPIKKSTTPATRKGREKSTTPATRKGRDRRSS